MTERRKHIILLLCLGLLYFLGNASIAVTDPVESNYTETAAEMLASGDFFSPRIYGNYWYDKPAFFYWELIAAFSLFGQTDFAARFFPAVFGTLGLFLTYFFARRIYDGRTGFWAAAILGSSFEYWLLSKAIITDMTLFVFFNAVLVFFFLGWQGNKRFYWLSYLFAALAVLTKGPIGILLPGLIVTLFVCWKRNFAEVLRMKPIGGMILFFLVSSTWYYAMYRIHGSAFLDTFLGVHNVLRATVSEHPMWDVWYYYIAIFFLGFLPWSFSLPMALRRYWKERRLPVLDDRERFLLLWAIVINVFYQLMATKYSTYTLPGLLPIAILTARLLIRHEKLMQRILLAMFAVFIALTFGLAIPRTNIGGVSGKPFAPILKERLQEGDMLTAFGDYSTSTVYYTGHEMFRLLPRDQIEDAKPKSMSWTTTNVMPYFAIEDLPYDRDIYMLVKKKKRQPRFPAVLDESEWQLVAASPEDGSGASLYWRPARKD